MTDIVERLRYWSRRLDDGDTCQDAADEIERLRAESQQLRAMLGAETTAGQTAADIYLTEATERLEVECFRQHPQCSLYPSGHLLVPSGVAVNLRDLAKAVLGMRVTRW